MKQFDIVANPFPSSRHRQPFLVTLQHDLLVRNFDTTIVAPLEPASSGKFADRLNPRVEVEGQPFAVIAQELATVRTGMLGEPCGSVAADRDRIAAALDLLFTGF